MANVEKTKLQIPYCSIADNGLSYQGSLAGATQANGPQGGLANATGVLISEAGGKRNSIGERWDLIPGIFTGLREVAKVASYGALKYGERNWVNIDPQNSEQSPLNHGIRHAAHAAELRFGSPDRNWQLAKAAWNLLAQIAFERAHTEGPPLEKISL